MAPLSAISDATFTATRHAPTKAHFLLAKHHCRSSHGKRNNTAEFDRYSRARIDHTRDDQRDPMYHTITITTTIDETIEHDYEDSQT